MLLSETAVVTKGKAMSDQTLANFLMCYQEAVIDAMNDAMKDDAHAQYRLGVRRLAKAYFDNLDLFNVGDLVPALVKRDVDAWYAGRE